MGLKIQADAWSSNALSTLVAPMTVRLSEQGQMMGWTCRVKRSTLVSGAVDLQWLGDYLLG